MVLPESAGVVGFAGKAPSHQTEPREPRSQAQELADLCCLTCSGSPNLQNDYLGFNLVFSLCFCLDVSFFSTRLEADSP